MSFGILNLVMLFGLIALIIPPLIHLLNRRRYEVVDWGAMQFLEISETTRRRLMIEELLLMALRMGLIAVLVLALAAPFASGPLLAELATRPNRDVVLLFDGSASMALDDGKNRSPDTLARTWANRFLDQLQPGDTVTLLHVRQQVVPILGEPTRDLELVREKLAHLPPPAGGADWPHAVAEAEKGLQARGQHGIREIIVLSDGQKQGWADSERLFHWQQLAGQRKAGEAVRPKLWVVNVNELRQDEAVPSYSLAPVRAGRALAVAGQRLRFRTALLLAGLKSYEPPHRIRLQIDGQGVEDIPVPATAALEQGQVALSFSHRFPDPGVHLVSVTVEADPPTNKRPPQYALKDRLPADNRRDLAVEVIDSLPVLVVDGASELTSESPTFFVRKALTPSSDPTRSAAVLAHTVALPQFDPALLGKNLDPQRPQSRPRVLVLADVPSLTGPQQKAIEQFLGAGGSVLVALGPNVDKAAYNRDLFQNGKGWLPARLDALAGDRDHPELAASPDLKQSLLPAFDLFRDEPNCTLGKAKLPRWWKVTTTSQGPATPVALLTTTDPLLVEQPYRQGRVLLCTVPLDRSWGSTLPRIWEFPVLLHELLYHLADTRSGEFNLPPGQPLRYRLGRGQSKLPDSVELFTPTGEKKSLPVENGQVSYPQTADAGVYQLTWEGSRPIYFVVEPDGRESDVRLTTEQDRKRVADLLPLEYQNDVVNVARSVVDPEMTHDLWWLLLVGVIVLLCGEIWLTRRMVAKAAV